MKHFTYEPKAPSNLSKQLRGIHHVGITVEDMGKALEFYIEVLGGRIIGYEAGMFGDMVHNTLLQKEEIEAIEKGIDLKTIATPNLRDREQELDVIFIQFDNVVLELLQYRDPEALPGGAIAYEAKSPYSSPAIVNAMHVSFYLNDEVDINEFVKNLEAECEARGMDQVRCNRIVRVKSEAERKNTELQYNSGKLDESAGDLEGWTLVYCKGPNGEQLEFNQVTRKAKVLFDTARNEFLKAKAAG